MVFPQRRNFNYMEYIPYMQPKIFYRIPQIKEQNYKKPEIKITKKDGEYKGEIKITREDREYKGEINNIEDLLHFCKVM